MSKLPFFNFISGLVLALAYVLAGPAFAQDQGVSTPENSIAELLEEQPSIDERAIELMLDSWEPNPSILIKLIDEISIDETLEQRRWLREFGLGNVSQSWRYNACSNIFEEYCGGTDRKIAESLMKRVVNSLMNDQQFIGQMHGWQTEQLAAATVDFVGPNLSRELLTTLEKLYTEPFDSSMALEYQRWRTNACNFAFMADGGGLDNAERRERSILSIEECGADRFTSYLMERYCEPSSSPHTCDVVNISWVYGFLSRRYIAGGEQYVANWQKLAYEAALAAEVEFGQSSEEE